MRARSENLDIYLEDIVPTQEIELFVRAHLRRSGFDGALVIDSRYPDGKYSWNVIHSNLQNFGFLEKS